MAALFPTSIVGEWGASATADLDGRAKFLDMFPEVFDPYGTNLYVMERLSDARFNEAMKYLLEEAGATVMNKGADAGRSSIEVTFHSTPRDRRVWRPIPVEDGSDKVVEVFEQAQEAIPVLESLIESLIAHYTPPVVPTAPAIPALNPVVARMFAQARKAAAERPAEPQVVVSVAAPPPAPAQLYEQILAPQPFSQPQSQAPAAQPPAPTEEWVPVAKGVQRVAKPPQDQRQRLQFCRFAGACRHQDTCPYVHGDTMPRINRACMRGQACPHRATCVYIHPGERYTPGDLIYRHH